MMMEQDMIMAATVMGINVAITYENKDTATLYNYLPNRPILLINVTYSYPRHA